MKLMTLLLTFSFSTLAMAGTSSKQLSVETLCNLAASTSKLAPEEVQKEYSLCVLKGAAKNAFDLVDRPELSAIQKISQHAEAMCGLSSTTQQLKACYLKIVNEELSK